MTLELEYYIRYGAGDCSDTLDWEVELTPEEEANMRAAMDAGEDLEDVLPDALARASKEIMAQELENMAEMDMEWEDGWSLEIEIVYPEDEE